MRTRLPVLLRLAAAIAVASTTATSAVAGDCRGLVQPLLRSAQPAPADVEAARRQCAAEAGAGDADAQYQLALTSLGLAGNWDPDAAIPRIRAAAAGGVSEAQYWLAWQSEAGPLLPHDDAVALGWYRQAAAARHRLALDRLARAYEDGGLGLSPDPREALRLRAEIRQCAEQLAAESPP